jgi:type I restriction enzyme S subunit
MDFRFFTSDKIAKKLWQVTGGILKQAHQNRLENECLATLRGTLFPKLS